MTRIWYGVKPEELCDQHLQGEYSEILKALGGLYNHPYGLAMTIGQVKDKNIDTSVMEERFYKVREEMENRGFNPTKSIPMFIDLFQLGNGFLIYDNIMDLMKRADRCQSKVSDKDRCFEPENLYQS